jgi:hypothetical protein
VPPALQSWQPRGYDVLPDGRFINLAVVFEGGSAGTGGEVRFVLNWFEELKRLVPTL